MRIVITSLEIQADIAIKKYNIVILEGFNKLTRE